MLAKHNAQNELLISTRFLNKQVGLHNENTSFISYTCPFLIGRTKENNSYRFSAHTLRGGSIWYNTDKIAATLI